MTSLGSQKDWQDTPFVANSSLLQGWSKSFMPASQVEVSQKVLCKGNSGVLLSHQLRESEHAQEQGSSGKLL